ncbi:MAG: hypothetical protein IJV31_10925 [Clostridia bacterium]|nr:hypothetical protein [Clostridia bacterium]
MEETKKSKWKSVTFKMVLGVACVGVIIVGGNLLAKNNGYDNVFLMIGSNLQDKSTETNQLTENNIELGLNENIVIEDEETSNQNTSKSTNESQKTVKKEVNKDYVYERDKYTHESGVTINIPYININSAEADKINNELMELFNNAKQSFDYKYDKTYEGYTGSYINLNYKYSIIKNSILSVNVNKGKFIVLSGGNEGDILVYNFDLTTGKTLTTKEVLKILNCDEAKIKERILTEGNKNVAEEYRDETNFDLNKLYFISESKAKIPVQTFFGNSEVEIDLK